MTTKEYLQILQNKIQPTAFATVDETGLPQVRIIDIMLVDENSLNFITAKVCPQQCIDKAAPYFIRQENFLHCGLCQESCPSNAI